MQTETFDNAADFAAALKGKKRKPARDARPNIPRGPDGTGDRLAQLGRIARYGYSPRWDAGVGFSFWRPSTGARTTAHQDYAAACVAAGREVGG